MAPPDTILKLCETFSMHREHYRSLQYNETERAARFRTNIRRHYAFHDYAEPGHSRRILSPNGRIGDLTRVAAANATTPKQRTELKRLTSILRQEKIQTK